MIVHYEIHINGKCNAVYFDAVAFSVDGITYSVDTDSDHDYDIIQNEQLVLGRTKISNPYRILVMDSNNDEEYEIEMSDSELLDLMLKAENPSGFEFVLANEHGADLDFKSGSFDICLLGKQLHVEQRFG